ncbi:MAG: efflux RND transporter permease subunit [Caulobacter sp.]|nr:efflux RND transporter permease subunit [Caulobacter sp.]
MFRNISAWSIKNPVPTLLLFVVLTVAGVAGFMQMRVNNFPDIDFPVVVVTAVQPGAAPSEMEGQITRILEDAMTGLNGAQHVTSTIGDGVSSTIIEFKLGTDLEKATNDVRNAVSRVRSALPGDINDPVVRRIEASGSPLIYYVVRAPGLTPEQKSWFVDNDVAKALLAIPGVAQVNRDGGVTREIRVDLDPDRLAALGVTAATVSQQLRGVNADLPGGRATIGGGERAIRTLGGADSLRQLRDTRINLLDGRSVRLADLGQVTDSWSEPRSLARFNDEEVVGFNMVRTRDGSEVGVAKDVDKVIAALDTAHPELTIEEVSSNVRNVQASYIASIEALGLGSLLAVIVVWLFLRDWRATFITAVAMPLALIPTFAILAPLNQSFNVVTLLALSLTIGILVDDAIVEIENIVRHMREGRAPYPAAMVAADEIGLAVVATTFTIVAVFAPVGFMGSVPGQFFKSFALAACVSVLFSLVVARMLTPLMCAYILKADTREHGEPFWMGSYLRAVKWSIAHRWVAFGMATMAFVVSVGLAMSLSAEFIPAGDQSVTTIAIELPPGARLSDTDAVVRQVTGILRARPEVKSVYASIGSASQSNGPGGGGSLADVRRAHVYANLVPKGERALGQQAFEREMARAMSGIAGARLGFGSTDNGQSSGISVTLVSDDGEALSRAARLVETQMRGIPGLENVVNTADIARPEILVTPKPDQAARMGVSAAAISQAVRVATIGDVDQALAKFNVGDRQIPIRLRLDAGAREDLAVLANLRVPTSSGVPVPLSAVADIAFGAGPSQISRLDRGRNATISAELNGLALGAANARLHALPAMKSLPAGVKEQVSGIVERLQELVTGFGIALLTGILLMYVVLVLLFKSFIHPITIQAALPLAIGGAFGLLLLTGRNLSMPALIGILMLMGIAAKNSILLVEYALEAIAKRGLSPAEAIIDACHKRARPILMTTVAMGAGMLPVAMGFGEDTEFRSPMAIAVIGGLITSTLLSLLFVPVIFTIVDDITRRFRAAASRLFARQRTPPPVVEAR